MGMAVRWRWDRLLLIRFFGRCRLPILVRTGFHVVGFRLGQEERLQDEILAMGVLALNLEQSVVVGRARWMADAGRRCRNGQVRRQLLQIRIASHHRNALLRPQVEPQQLRLSGRVAATRTRQRPLLLDQRRDGRQRGRLAAGHLSGSDGRPVALQDVRQAQLPSAEFAAADRTAIAAPTASLPRLLLVQLLPIGHRRIFRLLPVPTFFFLFFVIFLFLGISSAGQRRRRRRRRHQRVEEVDGQLVGHQVSLELFQRQGLAAQRTLDPVAGRSTAGRLLLLDAGCNGRRMVRTLVSEQVSQRDGVEVAIGALERRRRLGRW